MIDAGGPGSLPRPSARIEVATEVALLHSVHVAELDGLEPGTAWDYQVVSSTTTGAVHRFWTAPAPDAPVRFGWMADNQEGYQRFATHLEHLQGVAEIRHDRGAVEDSSKPGSSRRWPRCREVFEPEDHAVSDTKF